MAKRVILPVVALVVLVAGVAGAVALRPDGERRPGGVVPGSAAQPPLSTAAQPSLSTAAPLPRPAAAGTTIAAVGDIACDPGGGTDDDGDGSGPRQCRQRDVSDLLLHRRPAALLALGDTQYSSGSLDAYRRSYDPTFGRLLDITHPVPGNHEYETPGARGYYTYFGARAGSPDTGYYSFDLAGWHVVALNSNCEVVSCRAGGEQERWFRADLAAHPVACTLAYWHYPRWSHGQHGDIQDVAPLMQAAYDGGVEVVLTGHDHDYERYVPRAPSGATDRARGVREFVVGTGGRNLRTAAAGDGTESMGSDTFGALLLTLTPTGYSWQFAAAAGAPFSDSGSDRCH